jgi:Family of unknown function (DUF5320)
MPGFNQTGPTGQGPMTGRKIGRCTNFANTKKNQNTTPTENQGENQPDNFQGRGPGFGWRMGGRGRGMGRQNRFKGGF